MSVKTYIKGITDGVASLATGLKTTMKIFFRRKTTEEYPENRGTLRLTARFRGCLIMPHDAQNRHRCIGCGLCQLACPNDTIKIVTDTVETTDGKKKRILAAYQYDIGSCMFCQLCVNACPHQAITFDQSFEHAVFNRNKLFYRLNREGSTVIEKTEQLNK
jgi:NADH-quinone oxidoreductase subunit I